MKYIKEHLYEKEYRKALFLDMDGTLIKTKSQKKFPTDSDDWMLNNDIIDRLYQYQDLGYLIMVVTNQGGIQSGFVTEETVKNKIEEIIATLKRKGITVTDYYYSKTILEDDPMRKPNPGMALEAKRDYGIILSESIMVGDMDSDREFAKNAKIGTYYDINDFIKS